MSIDLLYKNIAEFHNITVSELKQRIVNGERLVHEYWMSQ